MRFGVTKSRLLLTDAYFVKHDIHLYDGHRDLILFIRDRKRRHIE